MNSGQKPTSARVEPIVMLPCPFCGYGSDWNSRAKRPEDVRLVSAVNSLLGYATTCKEQNTEDWMDGLLRHINATLEQIGDDDRVATFKDGFQVITPADVHETSGPE